MNNKEKTMVTLTDGCTAHGIPASQVATWWRMVEERKVETSVCTCCFGPSPSGLRFCKRCSEITVSIWA